MAVTTTTMQFGFQTILWGPRFSTKHFLVQALDAITQAGFKGVEFSQHVDRLGVNDIAELLHLLKKRNLTLAGLAGGTLESRMKFCGNRCRPYLYVEDWDQRLSNLVRRASTVDGKRFDPALHLHVFRSNCAPEQANKLLDSYQELKFIPDTAHLAIMGHDPAEIIRETREKIIAVHLKDWTPSYGRSTHRYAKGFVELGKGDIRLVGVLKVLQETKYEGWVIVELDSPSVNPSLSVIACADFLRTRGFLGPETSSKTMLSAWSNEAFTPLKKKVKASDEARFVSSVREAANSGPRACAEAIAGAFLALVPSELVTIWTCSPAENLMSLLASDPVVPIHTHTLECRIVLSWQTLSEQWVQDFDLRKKKNRKRFGDRTLLSERKYKRMISIPVLNTHNPHHVQYLVSLFPKEVKDLPCELEELFCLGRVVALAMNTALEELCASAAWQAGFLAGKSKGLHEYLKSLVHLIGRLLECEGVAIFLVDELGTRLELKATTGTSWRDPTDEHFYQKGKGLTGIVWEKKVAILSGNTRNENGWEGKSYEEVLHDHDNCLIVPLMNHSRECIGVVRCRNKRPIRDPNALCAFSHDDEAVLEAINQAAVNHIELLRERERRQRSVDMLTEVLVHPLERISKEVGLVKADRRQVVKPFFKHDYPGDLMRCVKKMQSLLTPPAPSSSDASERQPSRD